MNKTHFVTTVVTLGLIAVLLFVGKMFNTQKLEIMLQSAPDEQTNVVVPSDIADPYESNLIKIEDLPPQPLAGWQTYVNKELGFSVNYPEEWHTRDYWKDPRPEPSPFNTVGFDPWERNPGGTEWTVTREDATGTPEEQLKDILISSSSDARYEVTKTEITHGVYPAVYTTTINNESETGIVVKTIVIPRGQYIYSVSTTDHSQVVVDTETKPYYEGEVMYRSRQILFKDLSEKGYPEIFLDSFRILEF